MTRLYAAALFFRVLLYDVEVKELVSAVGQVYGGFEFADGYLVYLKYDYREPPPGFEGIAEYGKDITVLKAFDFASAVEVPVLEPTPATIRPVDNYAYEVMLAPVEPVPPPIKESYLYREYEGEYVLLGTEC